MGDKFNPNVCVAAKDDERYATDAGVDLNQPVFVFGKTKGNLLKSELEYIVIAQNEALCREVLSGKIRGGSSRAAEVSKDMSTAVGQPPVPDLEDGTVIKTCCSTSSNCSVLFAGIVGKTPKLVEAPGTRFILANGRRGGGGLLRQLKEVIISKQADVLIEYQPDPEPTKAIAQSRVKAASGK